MLRRCGAWLLPALPLSIVFRWASPSPHIGLCVPTYKVKVQFFFFFSLKVQFLNSLLGQASQVFFVILGRPLGVPPLPNKPAHLWSISGCHCLLPAFRVCRWESAQGFRVLANLTNLSLSPTSPQRQKHNRGFRTSPAGSLRDMVPQQRLSDRNPDVLGPTGEGPVTFSALGLTWPQMPAGRP